MLAANKLKTLPTVKPNAGFEASYRRRLVALVRAMSEDVERQIRALYREKPPEMAGDESPAAALTKLMRKLRSKWLSRFDKASDDLARYFAKEAADRSDAVLRSILRRGGFSVKFTMTREVNDIIQATISENVSLIRSIPEQHLTQVEGLVMRSVSAGRDLKTLTADLQKRYGITKRRAAFIASDQNNKMTANIQSARQQALGITEGIWRHSRGGNHPREAHVAYSGKRFNLKEGVDFGDGMGKVLPGQAPGCKCTWAPVIPGFEK